MADVGQYVFDLKEVTTALIKQQNLHEGTWFLALEFGLAAAHIEAGPGEVHPAAIVAIKAVMLQRVSEGQSPPFAVDAAELNPVA